MTSLNNNFIIIQSNKKNLFKENSCVSNIIIDEHLKFPVVPHNSMIGHFTVVCSAI